MKNQYLDKLLKDEKSLKNIVEHKTSLKYEGAKPEIDPVLPWTDLLTVSCKDRETDDDLILYFDEFSIMGIERNGEKIHQDQAQLVNTYPNMSKILDNFTIYMIKNNDQAYFKKLLTYREQLINHYLEEERVHTTLYNQYSSDTQISEGKRKKHLAEEWEKAGEAASYCDLQYALKLRAKSIHKNLQENQSGDESGN